MPRSTFLSNVSFRYAAINPKRGSSGACGTWSGVKTVGLEPSIWPFILASLSTGLIFFEEVEEEGDGAMAFEDYCTCPLAFECRNAALASGSGLRQLE